MNKNTILLPEWALQSGLQLTWPHEATDWHDYLSDIQATYLEMADAVTRYEPLLVVTPHPVSYQRHLGARPWFHHAHGRQRGCHSTRFQIQWLGKQVSCRS